jgi:hypothetical protein
VSNDDTSKDLVPRGKGEIEPHDDESLADKIQRVTRELSELADQARELGEDENVQQSSSTDLVPSGSVSPESYKKSMALARSKALRTKKQIEIKQAELKKLLDDQMSQAMAVVRPLQEMVSRLEDAIRTVNLFTGRDEEILTLRGDEYEPASADEPIVVRQMVLAMDEECAAYAEEGGIDSLDIEEFDEWLLSDPAHLDQVLPEQRGIVALVPRFDPKNYYDPWKNAVAGSGDRQTYFLIRNGQRLYRMWTAYSTGKTLVPKEDEFTSFFRIRGVMGQTDSMLKPGTESWARAEKAADARKRHYMKAALILEGLIQRTKVLHPLPAGASFLDPEAYHSGTVRVVLDAENTLASGRESFRAWQKSLMKKLRVGMRIVGAFNTESFRESNWFRTKPYDAPRSDKHSRLKPSNAPYPRAGRIYTLSGTCSDEEGQGLTFRYEYETTKREIVHRKGDRHPDPHPDPTKHYVYARNVYDEVPVTRKGTCQVFEHDDFVLPLDLVSVEDMRYYLHSRANRRDYANMFPLLKEAIRIKEAEAAEEAPFRLLLTGTLAKLANQEVDEIAGQIDELILWYKTSSSRHRPLLEDDRRALAQIKAEYLRRLKHEGEGAERLDTLLERHPDALLIARKGSGAWVVLTPAESDNVFVHRHEYSARLAPTGTAEWILPKPHVISRWTTLHQSDRWGHWKLGERLEDHLTGPEREQLARELAASGPPASGSAADGRMLMVTYDRKIHYSTTRRLLHMYAWAYHARGDAEHLLTRKVEDASVYNTRYYFERTRTGIETKLAGYHATATDFSRMRMPDSGEVEVLRDQAVLDEIAADSAANEILRDARAKLQARRRVHELQLQAAWLREQEKIEHARFLADYADEELWPDHREGLDLRWPHGEIRAVIVALSRALEAERQIEGMTVSGLVEREGAEDELPEDVQSLVFEASDA